MKMKLHPDFKEFIQLLNKHNVEYLIIGGYAVAVHGYVRATGDIDIWIKISVENAEKIVQVLKDFGFSSLKLTPEDFQKENIIIQFGVPPYRIDILTSPEGLNFDECFADRFEQTSDDGTICKFIDKQNLLKNKKIVGRSKDIDDIENLSFIP
jgi:hypothetical protein